MIAAPPLATDHSMVSVEASARILRGCAVPFGVPTLVGDRDDKGNLVVARETFDAESLIMPKKALPLLVQHDASRPIGRVVSMWPTAHSLQIEAELIGSSSEIDSLREKIGSGLQAGLSIGFWGDGAQDKWSAPTRGEKFPSVLRRGARLREISLCVWPAYREARVSHLRNRTEAQLDSDQLVDAARARIAGRQAKEAADAAAASAKERAWLADVLADLDKSTAQHRERLAQIESRRRVDAVLATARQRVSIGIDAEQAAVDALWPGKYDPAAPHRATWQSRYEKWKTAAYRHAIHMERIEREQEADEQRWWRESMRRTHGAQSGY